MLVVVTMVMVYRTHMQQTLAIYVTTGTAVTIVWSVIVAIALAAWWLSHRLTKMETKVDMFEGRLTSMDGRIDNAMGHGSPIKLLQRGEIILEGSGFKKYIDDNQNELLDKCCTDTKLNNQYDIQEAVFKFFDTHNFGDFENKIKNAAFNYGSSIEVVRRIGGIYFRDICLGKHGYSPEDLDKPTITASASEQSA